MIAFALALAAAPALARAQSGPPIVNARILLATDAVHAGSKIKMAIVAEIPPGFHINDHKPTLEYLIPTEVKLDLPEPLGVGGVFYPRGKPQKFSFEDKPLSVYEGTVVIGALLEITAAVAPGEYTVKGKFSYQACNDHACFPPFKVPMSVDVKVVGQKVPVKSVNQDVFRRATFK